MNETSISIEQFWDNLLSREPASVRQAYATLEKKEQVAVLVHLRKMVSEPGWQPEQRASAAAALEALGGLNHFEH